MNAVGKQNSDKKYAYRYSNENYSVLISTPKAMDFREAADLVEEEIKRHHPYAIIESDTFHCTSGSGDVDITVSEKGGNHFINAVEIIQQFKTMILEKSYADNDATKGDDEMEEAVEDDVDIVNRALDDAETFMTVVDDGLADVKKSLRLFDRTMKKLHENATGDKLEVDLDLKSKMRRVKHRLTEAHRNLQAYIDIINKNLKDPWQRGPKPTYRKRVLVMF